MKKIFAMLLALAMMFSLVACGGTTAEPTTAPAETVKNVEGTMEELLNKVIEIQPVEFMGGSMTLDLTDTSEDGLWMVKNYTGLDNADSISEAAFFEPMMGSIPYSMVMVRTAEGADVKSVAEGMKNGIDQRKWICVEADDLQVVSYGDVVMLIMVGSDTGMTSQSYVDAFKSVTGIELDFAI
jgi:hypothetical protein